MISVDLKKRVYTSISLVVLLFIVFNFKIIQIFTLIIIGIFSIVEFLNIIKKLKLNKFLSLLFNIFFITYIFIFCFLFSYLSNFYELYIITFIIIFGCIASDVGGFVFGKVLKGPKLTNISPKKTIAGAFGSLICTCTLMPILIYFFFQNFNYLVILISLITSASCQLGDLFFSYLKRKAKLKDTGNLLPGHGGILDRIDGIIISLPVSFIFIALFF